MRFRFVAFALATIVAGLAVHWHGSALPPWLRDVVGDALWAMMVAWFVAAIAPRASLRSRAIGSLSLCWLVEASQLLHTPILDAVRGSTLGHLVLGSDFDARDLAAYAGGVAAGLATEALMRRR